MSAPTCAASFSEFYKASPLGPPKKRSATADDLDREFVEPLDEEGTNMEGEEVADGDASPAPRNREETVISSDSDDDEDEDAGEEEITGDSEDELADKPKVPPSAAHRDRSLHLFFS